MCPAAACPASGVASVMMMVRRVGSGQRMGAGPVAGVGTNMDPGAREGKEHVLCGARTTARRFTGGEPTCDGTFTSKCERAANPNSRSDSHGCPFAPHVPLNRCRRDEIGRA